MIKTIRIKGFRSLPETELTFEKVNIFSGEYPRTYLDAIGMVSAAASGVVDFESLIRRGVYSGPVATDKAKIGVTTGNIVYDVTLSHKSTDTRNPWIFEGEYLESNGIVHVGRCAYRRGEQGLAALKLAELQPDSEACIFFEELLDYRVIELTLMCLRNEDQYLNLVLGLIDNIKNMEKKDEALKGRREYLDSQLHLFGIDNSILDKDSLYYHSLSGYRLSVLFLLLLSHSRSPYLAIDGLRLYPPEYANRLIDLIKKVWSGGQLFIGGI